MLKGHLDKVTVDGAMGWAFDDAQPDEPVSLLFFVNGDLICRVVANRYRQDLEKAGYGKGRHGFDVHFPHGLSPFEENVIRVCRESDQANLARSPVKLPPLSVFDAAEEEILDKILTRYAAAKDVPATIDFLVGRVENLLQQHAA